MVAQFLIGLVLGILIGYLAYVARALSRSGAWAAALTGGLIFGLGGPSWAVLLLTFFVSSSLLSRAFGKKKIALNEKFSKGSQRDWGQVFANGGLGGLLAVAHVVWPTEPRIWIAFIGAMAAVNADTWATELGVLNPAPPRLITTGKVVERGASGGVSLTGSLAAFGGAALVGLMALLFSSSDPDWIRSALAWLAAATAGGLGGSFFDSFLGATIQAIYYCPACQKETERHPLHTCGASTVPLRGWMWMDNDLVNFACSVMGAILAVLVWWAIKAGA